MEQKMNLGNTGFPAQPTEADILKLPSILCDCGGELFESAAMIKKLSILISPTGKEEKIPANVMICKKCGKVPSTIYEPNIYILIPEHLKAKKTII